MGEEFSWANLIVVMLIGGAFALLLHIGRKLDEIAALLRRIDDRAQREFEEPRKHSWD